MANGAIYRLSIVLDIVMFLLVTYLSVALYNVLKGVHKNLALTGFVFRFGEAILGGMYVALSLGILIVLDSPAFSTHFTSDQRSIFIQFLLDLKNSSFNILIIFMGFGATIYCYLFYRSKYLPWILALWGIGTYVSMALVSGAALLFQDFPAAILLAVMAPSALFEISIGLWLFIKGIKITANTLAYLPGHKEQQS
jgi:hypothetical protein